MADSEDVYGDNSVIHTVWKVKVLAHHHLVERFVRLGLTCLLRHTFREIHGIDVPVALLRKQLADQPRTCACVQYRRICGDMLGEYIRGDPRPDVTEVGLQVGIVGGRSLVIPLLKLPVVG